MDNDLDRILKVIADILSIDASAITEASTFGDLGAASFDVVSILLAVEKEFGISVTDDDMESVRTAVDAAAMVRRLRK